MTIDLHEICVSSDAVNLARIAEFVGELARSVGMNESAVFDIQMAVDEACTNSITHAYAGIEDGEIRVCCHVDERDFVVSITDQGRPFDPSSVPEPDLSVPLVERQIGGLGLFFMRQLMDQIEFSSGCLSGNRVVMRKHRGQSSYSKDG
ncbi:MAG: ATP-binding protein [Anaerolineae bacterium]|nr:ATP-binding protein [Anaerolineae bacterium]